MKSVERSHLEQQLKQSFGYDTFHAGQREIIEQVISGHDAFALMPTGAGKSLIYQLAALVMPGTAIVVSPLIALMQDQVDRLDANGIAATFINSALSNDERLHREQAAARGEYKLLYIAPERLLSPQFLALLDHMHQTRGLSLLAVDEAHCVSEWGHDFRPEYRQLGQVRERFSDVPTIGLTATATDRVRADIVTQLHLRKPYIHVASFNRPNLYYEVRPKHRGSYAEVLQLLRAQPDASTIIYCQSRKSVDDLSDQLNRDGIHALPYHAGMDNSERAQHQTRFIRDDVLVLVATVAFGMGIGKPDVRMVIHYDIPRNLEGYYQESGRAGRDGLAAQCIVFFSYGDKAKIDFMIKQKESEQEQRIARQQLQQVIGYCETSACRRHVLLSYFSEPATRRGCDNCDTCLNTQDVVDRTVEAQKFLSCVGRAGERFGLRHIVDILRGAKTQKIRDLHHDQLTTYGIGQEISADEWLHIGRALAHLGYIRETDDGFPILKLTPEGKAVLRERQSVQIARFHAPTQKVVATSSTTKTKASAEEGLDWDALGLFQHLRALRKEIADELSVPAYVIFADSSLRAMAQQRPQSEEHFAQIPGVGAAKLAAYHDRFSSAIRRYCVEHNLTLGVMTSPSPATSSRQSTVTTTSTAHTTARTTTPPTRQVTLDLYRQGLNIEEIAVERNLAPSTIAAHLGELVESGEEIDIERLVSAEKYQLIAAVLHDMRGQTLTAIKDHLGEEYSFGELRIVRAVMRLGGDLPESSK